MINMGPLYEDIRVRTRKELRAPTEEAKHGKGERNLREQDAIIRFDKTVGLT